MCHIARIVNEGFFYEGGRIRGLPVTIGGCSYIPHIPDEYEVREKINEIVNDTQTEAVDIAVKLCLYCMKTQIFMDGNKRASVIFANHYLISRGQGFIVIPEKNVPDFKRLLVKYYEDDETEEINIFMKEKCWKNF